MGPDGTLYVGSDDHRVHAVRPGGTLLWSRATGGVVSSSPAVSNGVVYVGSHDQRLYAIGAP